MSIEFYKYQAVGNDFIIIDEIKNRILEDKKEFTKKYCTRKFSIGADGVLFLSKSKICDFKMRIFNSDGSEDEMCGNGIRCLSKYIKDQKLIDKNKIKIETLAGKKDVFFEDGKISVSMGKPEYKDDPKQEIDIDGKKIIIYYINTGVPHVVVFLNFPKDIIKKIRYHKRFQPQGTNVNIVDENDFMKVKTYERGVEDFTLSCGTGACASVLVKYLLDKKTLKRTVETKGGVLNIELVEKNNSIEDIILSGEVHKIYKGKLF